MIACTFLAGVVFPAAVFLLVLYHVVLGMGRRPIWWKKAAKELTTAEMSSEDRLTLQRNSRLAEELTAELKKHRRGTNG